MSPWEWEQFPALEKRVKELEVQEKTLLAQLGDVVRRGCEDVTYWQERCRTIEALVEKMKCCGNCKYEIRNDECSFLCRLDGSGSKIKWESRK